MDTQAVKMDLIRPTALVLSVQGFFVITRTVFQTIAGVTQMTNAVTVQTRETVLHVAMEGIGTMTRLTMKPLTMDSTVLTRIAFLKATDVMGRRIVSTDRMKGAVPGPSVLHWCQTPKLSPENDACSLSPTKTSGSLAAQHLTLRTGNRGAELKKTGWRTV